MINRFLLPGLIILLVISSCDPGYKKISKRDRARNIILLIGDGMGLAQISTAYFYQDSQPNFSRFKYIGLHQNAPVGAKITDSAAGATAFSAGVKSYNGAIGVDGDTSRVETILEMAGRRGQSTGVISTSSITHATPASFFAHTSSRNFQEEIARQLVYAPVNFIAGGGIRFFNRRQDGVNYLDSLAGYGFMVDTTSLSQPVVLNAGRKYAYLLADDAMPKMQEGRGEFLPEATQRALDYLSQDQDGFFLMVEGSQIDWGGHANDAEYIIEEVKDFDKAIGVALDFAEKDGNTLVVVTADHETGGLSLSSREVRRQGDYRYINPTFSTGGHSATLIPVLAYGPGAGLFSGIYQNTEIFHKMRKASRQ